MDIMLVFETSGVGSIPAWPAKVSMLIVPVNIRRRVFIENVKVPRDIKIPVRLANALPVLEQLGLLDLKNDVYAYTALMEPYLKLSVHKDTQHPVKWSLIIPPVGHEDINIDIVSIKEGAIAKSVMTPIGTPTTSYQESDIIINESWNLKHGACYFNPTDCWHRAVNNTNEPRIVYSLRSSTIEIDEILNRIT